MKATSLDVRTFSIAVRRLHCLPRARAGIDPVRRLVFVSELTHLGYKLVNPDAYDDSLLEHYAPLIETLRAMRGGQVDYVPLFQGFPERVPEGRQYLVDRIFGLIANKLGSFEGGTRLDSGLTVPAWLFDLEQFGADPISQLQESDLFQAGRARQEKRELDTQAEWVPLRIVSSEEAEELLVQFLQSSLYAASSIREGLRDDLRILLERYSVESLDPSRIVFREQRTFVLHYLWERAQFIELAKLSPTPTDLLRLLASLTGGDISLATPIRFPRLRRPQRRAVLQLLEGCPRLGEDLQRYRRLWLALGRYLHPGEFRPVYPEARQAFQDLYADRLRSFESIVEEALHRQDLGEALRLLTSRPGVFARRLHHLLRLFPSRGGEVLSAFRPLAEKLPLKNLFVLRKYFATIDQSEFRAVLNKKGTIVVLPANFPPLSGQVAEELAGLIQEAIRRQISQRFPSWEGKRVYLDPRLGRRTVPLSQRKASEGLLTLGRGSVLPLGGGNVLRLFVYWKDRERATDLDLSLVCFDDQFNYQGHVSYTQLQAEGIVHSGDLQSAPHGAAEFIDVRLEVVGRGLGCRYLVPQIHRYSGDAFGLLARCHAGWMLRDKVDSRYASFDVKTVQNKFDLTGSAGYCLPILVDPEARQVVFIDLYIHGVAQHNRVEGAVKDISTVCRQMVRMLETKPTLMDLAQAHVAARGARRVEEPEEADLRVGLEGSEHDLSRIERVLSDYL